MKAIKIGLSIFFITLLMPHLFAEGEMNYPKNSEEVLLEGEGFLKAETVANYMTNRNQELTKPLILYLYGLYQKEAKAEGINPDVALVQMMHETNFLRYNGDVHPNQFNFAGIGATGNHAHGALFRDMQTGIRGQIQHLKAYATDKPLVHEQVDPRYHLVRKGVATCLKDLTGRWAMAPHYDSAIYDLLSEMYQLQEELKKAPIETTK